MGPTQGPYYNFAWVSHTFFLGGGGLTPPDPPPLFRTLKRRRFENR